jgi:hypothetical protein
VLSTLLSSTGGLSKLTTTGVNMFWNKKYKFNDVDFEDAIDLLSAAITGLIADIEELRDDVDVLIDFIEDND